MLSTPTASINMQNRTARLISLAHCAEGFLLLCHGILAEIIGFDVDLANFPTRRRNDISTSEFL